MQALLNGLVSGLGIALLAIAFQVVYLPSRVFFIGLAGVYAAAPFFALLVRSLGGGWAVAIVVAVAGAILLAVFCEVFNHRPLARRGASEGAQLISSLGIYLVLVQVFALIWGNDAQTLRPGLSAVYRTGALAITSTQVVTAVTALFLLVLFSMVLMRSRIGLRMRALSDNAAGFALLGYDVYRHRLVAFAVAGLLAACASLTAAFDVGFDAHSGLQAVLLAIIAVIIGGRASFAGPVVGAVFLGLVRAGVVWYWSARWQEAVTFAILGLILLLRPQGLVGSSLRLEASQ